MPISTIDYLRLDLTKLRQLLRQLDLSQHLPRHLVALLPSGPRLVVIGYPVAWYIWRQKGVRRYADAAACRPAALLSYIVKLYTLRSILGLNGLLKSDLGNPGILGQPSQVFLFNQRGADHHDGDLLPYVILPIFLTLERIPALLRASIDLGAGGWDTFRRVVFPLSLPAPSPGRFSPSCPGAGRFSSPPQMVGGTTGFTIGRVIWSQFGLA